MPHSSSFRCFKPQRFGCEGVHDQAEVVMVYSGTITVKAPDKTTVTYYIKGTLSTKYARTGAARW